MEDRECKSREAWRRHLASIKAERLYLAFEGAVRPVGLGDLEQVAVVGPIEVGVELGEGG